MEDNEFFYFSSRMFSVNVMVPPINLKEDKEDDNILDLAKGKYEGIDFPVIFKQERGKKWGDILEIGWPNLYLISSKFKTILEENKLTGWKTFPVKVYDKKDNEVPGYYGFSVVGTCAPLDYSKSEILEKQDVPNAPTYKVYKGVHVDTDSWDKTDFFSPGTTYHIIITKKAADILKRNKITNLVLENLKNFEIDVSLVEGKY